jgi:hypothetical protein
LVDQKVIVDTGAALQGAVVNRKVVMEVRTRKAPYLTLARIYRPLKQQSIGSCTHVM